MKRTSFLLLAGLLASISLHAQSQPHTSSAWTVANLGATVNSPHNERFPTISADGRSLYFASDRPEGLGEAEPGDMQALDIYIAQRPRASEPWGPPRRLDTPINSAYSDHSVTLSQDGHWMYFSSDRPGGCGMLDIYVSYRKDPTDDFGWEEPVNLGCTVNSAAHDACPVHYVDEEAGVTTLYLVSNKAVGKLEDFDVYASRLDREEAFGAPALIEEVSSASFDGHFDPFEGLIWSSRKGGHGQSDLWLAFQDAETGVWSNPVNMGASINTEHNEEMPTATADGTTVFFPSDRPGGSGGFDLYVATHGEQDENR